MRFISTCKYLLVAVLAITAGITFSASVGYFPEAAASSEKKPNKKKGHGFVAIQNAASTSSAAFTNRNFTQAAGAAADVECTEVCSDVNGECLVDILAAEVDEYTAYRYFVYPRSRPSEELELKITIDVDGRDIAKMFYQPGSTQQASITLRIPPGEFFSSNTYWLQGGLKQNKAGATRQKVEPANESAKKIWGENAFWYNPIVSWKVDDIVDYNDLGQGNVCYDPNGDPTVPHTEPNVWTTCGREAKGVVSDGSSRQFLRVKAGGQGRACFRAVRDQNMPMPDPGKTTLNAQGLPEIDTQFFENQYWVKSIYTPPQEFETTNKNTRKVDLQIGYTPKNPYDGSYDWTAVHYSQKKKDEQDAVTGTTKKVPANQVTVHRPPVLLVHGLWSNSSTWSSGYVNPAPADGRVVDNGFSYPNAAPFASSTPNLKTRLKKLVSDTRKKDEIAATKIDLIAHSMGTLLSRSWLTHPEYRRPDNFQEGDVRKLVAVTAPQLGSSIANLFINLHNNFADPNDNSHANAWRVRKIEEGLPGTTHAGAVCALAENSPEMNFTGAPTVLGRAFTASGGDNGLTYPLSNIIWLFLLDYFTHIQPYNFNQPNDAMVAQLSQQGGLLSQDTPGLVHNDVFGVGATGYDPLAQAIYYQMDSPGGFSALPAVVGMSNGVTSLVPGRGAADAINFSTQCSSLGGPLYPGAGGAALRVASTMTANQVHPGITITTPVSGTIVRPGQSVPIQITVDPSLNPAEVAIWNKAGMDFYMPSIYLTAPPYAANLTIPLKKTGPLPIFVLVKNTAGEVLEGPTIILNVIPADAPVQLLVDTYSSHDLPTPNVPLEPALSRTLAVTGVYSDGTRRDLKGAALGTTYTSTNPAIAMVDAEGVVTPVALGIAFIVTEHRGVRAFTEVTVSEIGKALPPIEHSTEVTITAGGFRLDRETGRFLQEITIRNNSSLPLSKITKFVIANLPQGVRLTNSNGHTRVITPVGSPYRSVSVTGAKFFMPGASQSVLLAFTNDHGVPITYNARLFTASNP